MLQLTGLAAGYRGEIHFRFSFDTLLHVLLLRECYEKTMTVMGNFGKSSNHGAMDAGGLEIEGCVAGSCRDVGWCLVWTVMCHVCCLGSRLAKCCQSF